MFQPTENQAPVGSRVQTTFAIEARDSLATTLDGSATVSSLSINDAPILTASTPSLATITEDDVDNGGQTVGSVLGSSVADPDVGALEGIAVTGTVGTNGSWEYSLDGGTTWQAVGTVSESSALLLGSTNRLRFAPDGIDGGVVSFTYRAWDQTSSGAASGLEANGGSNVALPAGERVDTGAMGTGGEAALSSTSDTATLPVTSINDAPTIGSESFVIPSSSSSGTIVGALSALDPEGHGLRFTVLSGDGSGVFSVDPLTGTVSVADHEDFQDGSPDTYTMTVRVTDDGSPNESALATLTILIDGEEVDEPGPGDRTPREPPARPDDPSYPEFDPTDDGPRFPDDDGNDSVVPNERPTLPDDPPSRFPPDPNGDVPDPGGDDPPPAPPRPEIPPTPPRTVLVSMDPRGDFEGSDDSGATPRITVETIVPPGAREPFDIPLSVLDEFARSFDEDVAAQGALEELVTQAFRVGAIALTAGFVTWLLRAAAMTVAFASSAPLWVRFDPLPILGFKRKKKDEEKEEDERKEKEELGELYEAIDQS